MAHPCISILSAHHDHQALHEKLEATRRELEEERDNLDRMKREANGRFDQDRSNINKLKEELTKVKSKLDETRLRSQEEKSKLDQKIEEIKSERDSAQSEVENTKIQLRLCEDKSESINNQLYETIRKLKEGRYIQKKSIIL